MKLSQLAAAGLIERLSSGPQQPEQKPDAPEPGDDTHWGPARKRLERLLGRPRVVRLGYQPDPDGPVRPLDHHFRSARGQTRRALEAAYQAEHGRRPTARQLKRFRKDLKRKGGRA